MQIANMKMDAKLCYVDEPWAYFTTQELSKQWGDDWGDHIYEHNAGPPYTPTVFYYADGTTRNYERDWNEDGTPKWEVYQIAFRHPDLVTPSYGLYNSPYSVEEINRGAVAWLRTHQYYKGESLVIPAGTTLADFIRLVLSIEGEVYLPVTIK